MDQSNFTSEQIAYIERLKLALSKIRNEAEPRIVELTDEIIENLEGGYFVMAAVLVEELGVSKKKCDEMRKIFKVKRVS